MAAWASYLVVQMPGRAPDYQLYATGVNNTPGRKRGRREHYSPFLLGDMARFRSLTEQGFRWWLETADGYREDQGLR